MRGLVQKILRGQYAPVSRTYTRDTRQLIADMLQLVPKRRPGVTTMLQRPVLQGRIQNLISGAAFREEFSHTVFHGKHAIHDAAAIREAAKQAAAKLGGESAAYAPAPAPAVAPAPAPAPAAAPAPGYWRHGDAVRQQQARPSAGAPLYSYNRQPPVEQNPHGYRPKPLPTRQSVQSHASHASKWSMPQSAAGDRGAAQQAADDARRRAEAQIRALEQARLEAAERLKAAAAARERARRKAEEERIRAKERRRAEMAAMEQAKREQLARARARAAQRAEAEADAAAERARVAAKARAEAKARAAAHEEARRKAQQQAAARERERLREAQARAEAAQREADAQRRAAAARPRIGSSSGSRRSGSS